MGWWLFMEDLGYLSVEGEIGDLIIRKILVDGSRVKVTKLIDD